MAAPVEFVDFSRIYVSRSEMSLLRDICDKPLKRRTEDRTEEAERLADLGLIEVFANKEGGRQGLFATETGRAYIEYTNRAKRTKLLELVKWLIPLVLAIAALAFALRANSLLGWNAGRTASGTTGQSYQQRDTNTNSPTVSDQQRDTNTNSPAASDRQNASSEPQSGAADSSTASSESSQDPGASQNQGQQTSSSGEASDEAE